MVNPRLELPPSLWSTPDGAWPAPPPVQTKPALLPLEDLSWPNAERLFTRLLETEASVERATLYGLPGQRQGGIDVYARIAPSLQAPTKPGRNYAALQSRKVEKLTAASITSAVDDFLDGEWADRCSRFYYATSVSLRDTKLDAAVRSATDLLETKGIEFVAWGVDEVSELLRPQPRLVDDFFGRPWVSVFCGEESLRDLSRRVSPERARAARAALATLYRGAFRAQGASSTVTGHHTAGLSYVILDTQSVSADAQISVLAASERPEPSLPTPPVQEYSGTSQLMRRREVRPQRRKSLRSAESGSARTPVDGWVESARLRLLIGAPGSGKSSFLMFAATDILSSEPQSVALQRAHSGDVPLWLPFAFLCRHLAEATSHSVVSAIQAWITQQGGDAAWDAVQPALDDERAVLLVDGVDEWSDATSADHALGLVESFVAQRDIGAILTARPYALDKLNWLVPWARATLAPLTESQQLDLVHRSLTESEGVVDGVTSSPHADTFLAELSRVPALNPLLTTPLFLCVLARSWRGESLPPQRFRLFSELIRLLVDRHPQMRRRASSASGSEFSTAEMLTVLRGVAYQARLDWGSAISSRADMERLFRNELRRDDGLAYPPAEAARIATAALSQAEDEYGLLVPQGIGMVGFLHRVLLDQLAGEHLATLSLGLLEETLRARAGDPTWRDVLIAGLAAQVNAHINASLLTALSDDADVDDIDKYELIAAAIAADVAVAPPRQSVWVKQIIERVNEHPNSGHRIALIRSLVAMTKHVSLRPDLLATFARWLSASHSQPTSALWTLREATVDEMGVLKTLLWGLRHEDEEVQLNAAHAIAIRYAGAPDVGAQIATNVRGGARAIDQAFSLLCLGTGWPDSAELPALITWARAQVTPELRVCALHLLREAGAGTDALTPAEQRWFARFLEHEDLRPREHWSSLAIPFVQRVVAEQPGAASFVLDTLSGNGRNGGNRQFAWLLACTTFSGDDTIKDWVSGELASPDGHGLLLYNLSLIPESWRADPSFALNATATVREGVATPSFNDGAIGLSESLPDNEALEALLPALDSWRPVAVASALLQRFPANERVQAALRERLLGSRETATRLAPVALDVLGAPDGFDALVKLLRAASREGTDTEGRVVIAMAVADAWSQFVRDQSDPTIAAVMAEYDADELATLCAAVGPGFLTWHVTSVIAAWPTHPAVVKFALRALRHPESIAPGIYDPAPAAIIRTYGSRSTDTANTMTDAVLDQLAYLPPPLREALVDALTQSDLTPTVLIKLLKNWTADPDIWVQRAALAGLIRRVDRYRISANADISQLDDVAQWLRTQVRSELCAYGPDYEDHRQTAWVGMLELNELELHDGLLETIGEPTRPGTELRHILGGLDHEIVDLVNARWESIVDHFGDDIFTLLSAPRAKENSDEEARVKVLRDLSHAQTTHPGITELILREADSNNGFRTSTEYLLWSHRNGRRDLELFLACLDSSAQSRDGYQEPSEAYAALVDADAWDISDDDLRETMRNRPHLDSDPTLRALFCELFPADDASRRMFTELEAWFQAGTPRARRDWLDTLAIAVRASPARLLPIIVERAHKRLVVQDAPQLIPLLTAPLLRRLQQDPVATAAVRAVMNDPSSADTNTPAWAPTHETKDGRDAEAAILAQRTFLLATVLQHAGLLDEQSAVSVRNNLIHENPDLVVLDPFTGVERPLRIVADTLFR